MGHEFGHVVFGQVRLALSNLNKKNLKQTSQELDELIERYGHDAYVYLLQCLLLQIDFKDQKSARDQPKQQLLAQELSHLQDKPNFISIVCQAFDGVPLSDDFLPNLIKDLKLSFVQQVVIGLGLTHSMNEDLRTRGERFLISKLPEISPATIPSLSESVMQCLLYVLRTKEAFDKEREPVFKVLQAFFPEVDAPLTIAPLLYGDRIEADCKRSGMSPTQTGNIALIMTAPSTAAAVMQDLGYASCASPEAFKDVLSQFSGIAEPDVARMLGMIARTHSSLKDPTMSGNFFGSSGSGAVVGDSAAEANASGSWDLDVFVGVLREQYPSLVWKDVIRQLDYPGFWIEDQNGLVMIVTAFRKATQGQQRFPVIELLGRWQNSSGQLSLLRQVLAAPQELELDFSESNRVLPPMEEITVTNPTWCSIELVETLAHLCDVEGPDAVKSLLEQPLQQCPELLLMTLVHAKCPFGSMHAELVSPLLAKIFSNHPHSAPALRLLWKTRRAVLLNGMVEMWQRDPQCLPRLLDISTQTLNDLFVVLEARPPSFALDMAVLAASRDLMNLETWLNSQLEAHGDAFGGVCLLYLRERLLAGSVTIPLEAGALLLRVLGSCNKLSPTVLDDVKTVHNLCAQAHPKLLGGQATPTDANPTNVFAPDIEDEANSHFQKIYASEMQIEDVIGMLKGFKTSRRSREQEVFACMIHNLFDEYRFFPRYPEKELLITGKLFGSLIQHQLVSSITLGIALRYVLEALRKPLRSNMFRFGMCALEQFKSRLHEWPPYCHHILQMAHIRQAHPELIDCIQRGLAAQLSGPGTDPSAQQPAQSAVAATTVAAATDKAVAALAPTTVSPQMLKFAQGEAPKGLQGVELAAGVANPQRAVQLAAASEPPALSEPGMRSTSEPLGGRRPVGLAGGPQQVVDDSTLLPGGRGFHTLHEMDARTAADFLPSSQFPPLGAQPAGGDKSGKANSSNKASGETPAAFGTSTNIDTLLSAAAGQEMVLPEEATQDKIHFIFNNLSASNLDQKERDFREFLKDEWLPFLAQYIVVKRASIEPNYHSLYTQFVDKLKQTKLTNLVIQCSLENVKVLLRSDKITASSSERSLLKNLGSWLGMLTLAKNKPLLQKDLDLKELLYDAYDSGRLIAVIPFLAKILESCKKSRVFKAPNPWLVGLMSLLAELHPMPDLKLNIKFEIEVLCKNLSMELKEIKPTTVLCTRTVVRDNNPDWTSHDVSAAHVFSNPSSLHGIPSVTVALGGTMEEKENQQAQILAGGYSGGLGGDQNLAVTANYMTINPSIGIFSTQPPLKQYALMAINQAIRDIITPVVERSVTIACITTRELLLKDFALETDETKVRRAAHLMVQHLAGSLALVTCKEPLRVSMCNHLRTFLQRQNAGDQQAIEQAVQLTAADNLEFGCALIEKAAIDRALRDIDNALDTAINLRRKQPGSLDGPIFGVRPQPPFMSSLPEPLKPKPGGLLPTQLRVYEDFSRLPRQPVPSGSEGTATSAATKAPVPFSSEGGAATPNKPGAQTPTDRTPQTSTQVPPSVPPAPLTESSKSVAAQVPVETGPCTPQQALDRCNAYLVKLDHAALRNPNASLSMLPPDHEVASLVRQIPHTVMQTTSRDESAIGVAQKVFRRLYEAPSRLMREILIAVLEGIHACCGKLVKELTTWVIYSENELKLNREITAGLMRAHLLNLTDFDMHLGKLMDSGRNEAAVDFALYLLQHCVLHNQWVTPQQLAATVDALGKLSKNTKADMVNKVLEDVRAHGNKDKLPKLPSSVVINTKDQSRDTDPAGLSDQVAEVLEQWLHIDVRNDKACAAFITQLQQANFLQGDDLTDRFFRILIELSVDKCSAQGADAPLSYQPVEGLSKMVLLLVKYFADPLPNKVQLLTKVLGAYVRALVYDLDTSKLAFNQKPYHRLLHHLLVDLSDKALEPINPQLLAAVADTLHALRPASFPTFAFAWLEMVSHRMFMPKLINLPNTKGWPAFHRLLVDLFSFLEPYLRNAELSEPISLLYRGTLRVLLVLLHDFPELLCEYHFSLCDVIPPSGIQMRNLILSAFPRYIRPPDPFTPHLKVDLLPDIHKAPTIRSDVMGALSYNNLRADLESYLKTRQPANLLDELPQRLLLQNPADVAACGTRYNVAVINSLVLTVGTQAIVQAQTKSAGVPSMVAPSVSMDIFVKLARDLDSEGRYLMLNAVANQLRYPNSHTHYFSCVLLFLFNDADREIIQEQITRVLIERLIVNKPHPWGLLITFIELIRNPRYSFWNHDFVRVAKEIEMLFQSVARNCLPPQQAAAVMPPQLGKPDGAATTPVPAVGGM